VVVAVAEMWINIGPSHPSTHGLWDLRIKVSGEVIVDADPQVGYLHRSVEKILERKEFLMGMPITERLCYVANMNWTHLYIHAVERLMNLEVPDRAKYIRVIVCELNRIASHLFWLGAYVHDIGNLTMFLWPIREREYVLDLLEYLTGARMMYNYPRIGGQVKDVDDKFLRRSKIVCAMINEQTATYEKFLDNNHPWLVRTKGVGTIDKAMAKNAGLTGPSLRASGVDYDTRKALPYWAYGDLDFDVPVYDEGDCWARYRVRLEEIRESCKIVRQAVDDIPAGEYLGKAPRVAPKTCAWVRHEDPRGESMCLVMGTGGKNPYRVKFRSPAFVNISALPLMLLGFKVPDVPSIMGSIDVCIGEVDR